MFDVVERDISSIRLPRWGRVVATEGVVPWLVVGPDAVPVKPIRRFLVDFVARNRPGSVRSYVYGPVALVAVVAGCWGRVGQGDARRGSGSGAVAQTGHEAPDGGADHIGGDGGAGSTPVTRKRHLGDQYEPRTIRHSNAVLRSFYRFWIDDVGAGPLINPVPLDRRGHRPHAHHNPLEPFKLEGRLRYNPNCPRASREMPDERWNELFAALRSNRDRAILALAISNGARAAEVLGVRGADLDWGEQLVRVVRKGTQAAAIKVRARTPDQYRQRLYTRPRRSGRWHCALSSCGGFVAARKSARNRARRSSGGAPRGSVATFFHRKDVRVVGGVLATVVGLVAGIAGVVALWPTFRSTELAEDANRAAQSADLSVVRVDMTSTVELIEESGPIRGAPEEVQSRPVDAAAAKLVLHNSGEQAALVEELRVTVSKVWTPEGCHGAGGGITSVRYDFILPGDIRDRPMPLRLSKEIDFEVAGQSNDRLAITIGEEYFGAGWPWIISATAELVLTDGRTVRTGEFVLMNHTGVDEVVALVEQDVVEGLDRGACVQRNIRTLEEALRAPGEHSPSIRSLLDRLAELGFTATATPGAVPPTAPAEVVGWVAQLGSYPEATTTQDELRAAVDQLENRTGMDLQTARSSEYGSLTPGYWVVFHPGEFSNGQEALAFCSTHGITDDNSCVGRYLSSSADDSNLICRFSDVPGSASCVRP